MLNNSTFKIFGKPLKISKEEAHAILVATFAILTYHNRTFCLPTITVKFVKVVSKKKNVLGSANTNTSSVKLLNTTDHNTTATTIIHEMIHLCMFFGKNTNEKCTSTLTAKIKPDVLKLANILVKNTYRRAAYIAHCKISYVNKSNLDYYDDAQNVHVKIPECGKKYRRKKYV